MKQNQNEWTHVWKVTNITKIYRRGSSWHACPVELSTVMWQQINMYLLCKCGWIEISILLHTRMSEPLWMSMWLERTLVSLHGRRLMSMTWLAEEAALLMSSTSPPKYGKMVWTFLLSKFFKSVIVWLPLDHSLPFRIHQFSASLVPLSADFCSIGGDWIQGSWHHVHWGRQEHWWVSQTQKSQIISWQNGQKKKKKMIVIKFVINLLLL